MLVREAERAGLVAERAGKVNPENFHDFVASHAADDGRHAKWRGMLPRMHAINARGTVSDVEWAIMRLYNVVTFRKRAAKPPVKKVKVKKVVKKVVRRVKVKKVVRKKK